MSPARSRRSRIAIREITTASDRALSAAHRLLAASIPPGEVVALAEWRGTLGEREAGVLTDLHWHLMIAEKRRRVVGMASGTYLGSLNIGMVGYLVLQPSLRGSGVGSRLRAALRSRFERDARRTRSRPLGALVGEVESSNPWLRRLVEREGALALDFPYYQPALRSDDPPSPLVLYLQPLDRPRRSLPVAEVRRLLYAIWRRLYRIGKPLQRPAFRWMLRALAGRRRIGTTALA